MYGQRPDYGPFIAGGSITGIGAMIAFGGGVVFFAAPGDARRIAMIIIAVGLIPFAIGVFRFFWLRNAVGRADLTLDDPIPMGASGTAIYYRPLRGAELRAIEGRLQCEEEIAKGRGRNKRQKSKVVYDEALALQVVPTSTRIEVQVSFRIPDAGPATFECDVARTYWYIRLRLTMGGCPNTASSFLVHVAPGRMR